MSIRFAVPAQRRLWRNALACIAVIATGTTLAESVSDAIQMAREANPTILAAHLEATAARNAQTAAERSRLPTVSVDASWARLAHSPTLDMTTAAGRLQSPLIFKDDAMKTGTATLTLPLYTSGKISSTIAASRSEADAADAQSEATSSDVKLNVVAAYLGVLRSRAALRVAITRVNALEAHANTVRRLYALEGVPKTDLLAVEGSLENARADHVQASSNVRTAEETYNAFVGQPLARVPDLDESDTITPIGRGEVDVLSAEAMSRRPELRAIESAREALNAGAASARADGLPQLGLRAGWQHLETQILDRNDVASIGLGVSWKVFDSGQTAARVDALHAKARAMDARLTEARTAIRQEVAAALRNIATAQARLAAAERAVLAGDENLSLASRLYATGLAPNSTALDATSAAADAQQRRDTARYDLMLADYRLRHALGRL